MTSQTPSDQWTGRQIGKRYRVDKQLGSGGMGMVFLSTDTVLGKQVAVKLLKATLSEDYSFRQRFEREVSVCAALGSEHIVRIDDYGITDEGYPFFVMEYLVGETLAQRLSREQRLSPEQSISIIVQVCNGLRIAHQGVRLWRHGEATEPIKIVHRDLKPENIFLVPTELGDLVKILDFGIAKICEDQQSEYSSLTAADMFIGTFDYASPEQVRGTRGINERSDIYSLGMILYRMLSGTDPFGLGREERRVSGIDWAVAHATKPTESLRAQPGCEFLPPQLEAVVMQCLAKDPDERFASVDELRHALKAILGHREVGPTPSVAPRPPVIDANKPTGIPDPRGTSLESPVLSNSPAAPVSHCVAEDGAGNSVPVAASAAQPWLDPLATGNSPNLPLAATSDLVQHSAADLFETISSPPGPPVPLPHQPAAAMPEATLLSPPASVQPEKAAQSQVPPTEAAFLHPEQSAPVSERLTEVSLPPSDFPSSAPAASLPVSDSPRPPTAETLVVVPQRRQPDSQAGLTSIAIDTPSALPSPPKPSRKSASPLLPLGIGAAALLLTAGGGFAAYQWVQGQQATQRLSELLSLKTQAKYADCITKASDFPSGASTFADAQVLLNECRLGRGQELAVSKQWQQAMNLVTAIPNSDPNYKKASTLIDTWSDSILKQATDLYAKTGKVDEAVALVKNIPERSSLFTQSQSRSKEWQQESTANQKFLQSAKKALNEGRWQSALDEANKISANTPYWKQQRQPIIAKAQGELDRIAAIERQRQLEQQRRWEQQQRQSAPPPSQPEPYDPPPATGGGGGPAPAPPPRESNPDLCPGVLCPN